MDGLPKEDAPSLRAVVCYTVNTLSGVIPKKPLVIGWLFGIVGV